MYCPLLLHRFLFALVFFAVSCPLLHSSSLSWTPPVFSTLTRPSQLLTSSRWKTIPTLITGSVDATREITGLIQACAKPGAVKLCSRRGCGRDLCSSEQWSFTWSGRQNLDQWHEGHAQARTCLIPVLSRVTKIILNNALVRRRQRMLPRAPYLGTPSRHATFFQ